MDNLESMTTPMERAARLACRKGDVARRSAAGSATSTPPSAERVA